MGRLSRPIALLGIVTVAALALPAGTAAVTVGGEPAVPAWIAFSRTDLTGTHIFKVWEDGSRLTKLTDGRTRDTRPAISPDGSEILFTRWSASGPSIWSMSRTGAHEHLLIGNATQAAWSWNGRWIALSDRDMKARISGSRMRMWTGGGSSPERSVPTSSHRGGGAT